MTFLNKLYFLIKKIDSFEVFIWVCLVGYPIGLLITYFGLTG